MEHVDFIIVIFEIIMGIVYIIKQAPEVMPPIYFQGNYNRFKESNNTIGQNMFLATKHYFTNFFSFHVSNDIIKKISSHHSSIIDPNVASHTNHCLNYLPPTVFTFIVSSPYKFLCHAIAICKATYIFLTVTTTFLPKPFPAIPYWFQIRFFIFYFFMECPLQS